MKYLSSGHYHAQGAQCNFTNSQEGEKGKRKPNENIPERNAFESWASAR